MIRFELDGVFGDWWIVTIGRSPDDITYTVVTDGLKHSGGFYRLENLIALYECTLFKISTDNHPMQGGYTIIESNGRIELEVDGQRYKTNYAELEQTLAKFLGDVFCKLNQKSTSEQRQKGIDYLISRDDLLLNFQTVYRNLT